jgi:hypothetical protein
MFDRGVDGKVYPTILRGLRLFPFIGMIKINHRRVKAHRMVRLIISNGQFKIGFSVLSAS